MLVYPNPYLTSNQASVNTTPLTNIGLADPVQLSFLLYGMKKKEWKALSKVLLASGQTQYTTKNYDGYTFYMQMEFNKLVNDGDSVGVELPLPADPNNTVFGWAMFYV